MNNQEDNLASQESKGSGLGFKIFMYFFLGAATLFIPMIPSIVEQNQKEQERQQQLTDDFEDIRQAVREGKGSGGFNILFKEEHEAFLKEQEAKELDKDRLLQKDEKISHQKVPDSVSNKDSLQRGHTTFESIKSPS